MNAILTIEVKTIGGDWLEISQRGIQADTMENMRKRHKGNRKIRFTDDSKIEHSTFNGEKFRNTLRWVN